MRAFWLLTGPHHDVEDDTYTPHVVGRTSVRDSLEDFRSGVGGAAAEGPAEVSWLVEAREAEVAQLHVVVHVQQDVFTFQIPERH